MIGVVLILHASLRRTGQVVHLIRFEPNGFGDVVADEFKTAHTASQISIRSFSTRSEGWRDRFFSS